MDWEFHFRNFDAQDQWFGVYHAGCGGAPWHQGRPRCWDCVINNNPTGGDNSVYVPASFVVNFDEWFKVILDGLEEVADIAMIIVTEGEDVEAWKDAVSTAFNIGTDSVDAALTDSNADLGRLMANSQAAFAAAAASIGTTTDHIRAVGSQMGLTHFGFIAGPSYQSMIPTDNENINDNCGWTLMHSPPTGSVDYLCNHAFIDQGHLILYWNSADLNGFWNPFS